MSPDTSNTKVAGIEIYNWPLNTSGMHPYYDTTLLFMDTHSSSINFSYYMPLLKNGTFKLGLNPFVKTGVWRWGAYDSSGLEFSYIVFAGGGFRILPHITTEHLLLGASFVPFAVGAGAAIKNAEPLDSIHTGIIPLPEMFSMVGIFAYYVTGFRNAKIYAGPFFQLYPPSLSGGINTGIAFFNNHKEILRVGISTAYFSEAEYKHYNLFPLAFSLSLWKRL